MTQTTQTKLTVFSDKAFFSKLTHITLPIAFQNLMLAAVAAADAIMLGFLHQNSMSAVSLATQVQFIQNMIVTQNKKWEKIYFNLGIFLVFVCFNLFFYALN